MNDLSHIFNHSHCLSKEQLIGYMQQTLDREEVYLVETHISDCEFCSVALDGLMEMDLNQTQTSLNELDLKMQSKLQEFSTIQTQVSEQKNHLKVESKRNYRWMAAASIALLIGLGGYSVFSYINSQKHELALNEKTKGKVIDEVNYNAPTNAEANEIVHLEVKPEELPKFEEAKKEDATSKKNFTVSSTNNTVKPNSTKEIIKDVAVSPKMVEPIASKNISPSEVAVPQKEIVSSKIEDYSKKEEAKYEEIAKSPVNVNNYMQDEKVSAPTATIVSKSPSGKMKKTQNYQNAPATNQLNYSTSKNEVDNNNNENELKNTNARLSNSESISSYDKNLGSMYEKGLSQFQNNEFKASIKSLEKALKNASSSEKEDIQYYLAQAYMKTGKENKAFELLNILANGNKYKTVAIGLLEQINAAYKKR